MKVLQIIFTLKAINHALSQAFLREFDNTLVKKATKTYTSIIDTNTISQIYINAPMRAAV